ncbi:MAG TPA: SusC/RagA family TonB-linked outer membrane protein, partial [Chitinophagaceae bacterium]|nr:SusC/RagA family TonB-linked outer membrane protein [Chitinophagaceae bacterium]
MLDVTPLGLLRSKPLLLVVAMAAATTLQAQTVLKGKVTNKKGEPVPSATVTITPGNTATVTDMQGVYELSTKANGKAKLNVSSVGYKTASKDVQLNGAQQNVDVVLEDDVTGLDEVVVTGTTAGTTRRQLGSYVSTVKADDLNKGAAGNVLQALQGKTAGAQIV